MCCFVRRQWRRHGLLPCPSARPTRRTGKIRVLPVAGASHPSSPRPIDGVEFFPSNALKYFVRIDRATSPRPIGGVADGRDETRMQDIFSPEYHGRTPPRPVAGAALSCRRPARPTHSRDARQHVDDRVRPGARYRVIKP